MTLSIIIPVYEVEIYIGDTLTSIFNQVTNEKNFEVVVVNDGTPDNSMAIVHNFAAIHSNLTIVNQTNQGLSAARNAGMKVAKGDYVWVVDSDDMVTDYSISEVLVEIDAHPNVDMFCFNLYEKRGENLMSTTLFTKSSYQKYYGKIRDGFFYCRKIPTGITQRFLFNKRFLQKHGLEFTPGIYHEDQDFLYRCYTKAQSILPLNNLWYIYNIRESGSITSTFKMKRFYDILWIIGNFRKLSQQSNDWKERTILEEGVFSLAFGLLTSPYKDVDEYRNFLKDNTKQIKHLLWYSYFKSIRKNSLGKSWRLVAGLFR